MNQIAYLRQISEQGRISRFYFLAGALIAIGVTVGGLHFLVGRSAREGLGPVPLAIRLFLGLMVSAWLAFFLLRISFRPGLLELLLVAAASYGVARWIVRRRQLDPDN